MDVIIDEGPDSINMMADTYDALIAMATSGARFRLRCLSSFRRVSTDAPRKSPGLYRAAQKPGPAQQIALEGEQAKVDKTKSETMLNVSKARQASVTRSRAPEKFELPPELQIADSIASTRDKDASAAAKYAKANKDNQEASLAPLRMMQDAHDRDQDRSLTASTIRQTATTQRTGLPRHAERSCGDFVFPRNGRDGQAYGRQSRHLGFCRRR